MEHLTPKNIVAALDRYIVGQEKAKIAVAIAMRNRFRRRMITDERIREEILPKNIIMMGPTGVGKTEIARRMADLSDSPFIKVEATKYTEVGYVGREVDSMVRDLVEMAVTRLKNRRVNEVAEQAADAALERMLDLLLPRRREPSPLRAMFAGLHTGEPVSQEPETEKDEDESYQRTRERLRSMVLEGKLAEKEVEIDIQAQSMQMFEIFSSAGMEEFGVSFQNMMGNMFPKQTRKKKVKLREGLEILKAEEAHKLIDHDAIVKEALQLTETNGIIFIDEIDKIVSKGEAHGPNVSREGVQRDLLPLVEGATVITKHGPVKTQHILFIAAGAFHSSKPSDLIPELQGRFPIRVELSSLCKDDFVKILKVPKNALCLQYQELLRVDGVDLEFTDDGIDEIAETAQQANDKMENIGARRLYTVMEKLLEKVSFAAPAGDSHLSVNRTYVKDQLGDIIRDTDLGRYIL
ncbi:MAG: ATP-dependent protease ATPase subunit HslU [Candidatus Wallbacteria bacterium]|nr:ATP-dependent protease ATPase subunit HslU [Candidatus Wallbacteria bacterium]